MRTQHDPNRNENKIMDGKNTNENKTKNHIELQNIEIEFLDLQICTFCWALSSIRSAQPQCHHLYRHVFNFVAIVTKRTSKQNKSNRNEPKHFIELCTSFSMGESI